MNNQYICGVLIALPFTLHAMQEEVNEQSVSRSGVLRGTSGTVVDAAIVIGSSILPKGRGEYGKYNLNVRWSDDDIPTLHYTVTSVPENNAVVMSGSQQSIQNTITLIPINNGPCYLAFFACADATKVRSSASQHNTFALAFKNLETRLASNNP